MSRKIPRQGPWNDADVEYMRSRPWQFRRQLAQLDDVRTPEPVVVPEPDPVEPVEEVESDASSPAPEPTAEEREYVMSLTVAELQKELNDAGLPTDGKKADLQKRLLAAYANGEASE